MSNVSYTKPEVTNALKQWDTIRDCLAGEIQVKKAGIKYLPMPNQADQSEENKCRYRAYVERAVFYNVTQRTLSGMVGHVFNSPLSVELPAVLESLIDDIDGAGVSMLQQVKKTIGETLAFGRCGLLVDYPETDQETTVDRLQTGNIRANITLYEPWDVINWRTVRIGAKMVLSMIVIAETHTTSSDGFEQQDEKQWRVLSLDPENGWYKVEIYRESEGTAQVCECFHPVDSQGQHFTEIPFTFIGSINNDQSVDLSPLHDLAVLNIAHYRNSADYEESAYIVGQPTPYFAGLTKSWVEDVLKNKIQLGSRAAIPLPEGGSAGLLQAQPNTMPKEAMEIKEKQMVALGARLVEQRNVARTLGEARLEESSETSILTSICDNVTDGYNKCLVWAGQFMGASESEIVFDINTDFGMNKMTVEDRRQLLLEWQSGAVTFTEMRDKLRDSDVATLEDEEAKELLQNEIDQDPGINNAA